MTGRDHWTWKLHEAADRIRERYDLIGRKTGGQPFLALVYPPEDESEVLREWHSIGQTLRPEYDLRSLDLLALTSQAVNEVGLATILDSMANPMSGTNPEADLGELWRSTIARSVHEQIAKSDKGKPVISLERTAALYPATSPRAVLQALWDAPESVTAPVVIMVPGSLREARTYLFLNKHEEFMYRGDIL